MSFVTSSLTVSYLAVSCLVSKHVENFSVMCNFEQYTPSVAKLVDTIVQIFHLIISVLVVCSVTEKQLWKSPSTTVDLCLSLFSCCFMYFEPLLFGEYKF